MSLGKRNPHTEDRDPHTGHMTTGHDWDGIKELNTPVPKVFFLFLAATVIASVIIWLLVPAWPTGVSYTKGLLGVDQRSTVTLRLAESEAARASWAGAIEGSDFAQIQSDDTLMSIVRFSGSSLFSDNCAACHGQKGDGGPGFPDLTSETWLWGGDADSVWETIRVGINSAHPESRSSEMLAFGRDQMLDRDSILDVVAYIQSLSQDDAQEAALDGEAVARGSEVFAMNCVACHGENATGDTNVGAPDLTSDSWIYGGDRNALYRSVFGGRKGHMPHWEDRLTPVERKILTLYVLDLANQGPKPAEQISHLEEGR